MTATQYIYDRFEFSDSYKQELVEFFRHKSNAEIGGYRMYDGSGSHWMQNAVEFADLVFALKAYERDTGKKLKRFLEVGFSAGFTNTILHKFFQFDEIVAVDWVAPWGISTDALVANMRFKNLVYIAGDSTDPNVVRKAAMFGPFDLIHVDGGHEYDVVKSDHANYAPLLAKDGVMAHHDIYASDHAGCAKFWREFRADPATDARWRVEEYFDAGNHTDYGIGALFPRS
ncbi:class I SAM-dependent methyltransferase [Magnetofaba australis]|uniref:Class I SAM-dependent methyltransferase n=1 Tax=Magnetofaba australis IT-1 TaxID=1434232 RepID=A0A1Y2K4D8_9PROT|nr:class I SAM-dependent methyltransferase [Magnetofaba australis]OSM02506.1 hypothetical protein MAIT1_02656 [Magnetofaba australis IT-1]